MDAAIYTPTKIHWNKGKIVGQKALLILKDIWATRIRLQLGHRTRKRTLFDFGLNSKLRACDLVRLPVRDIVIAIGSQPEQLSYSKTHQNLSNLKSSRRQETPLQNGSRKSVSIQRPAVPIRFAVQRHC